MGVSLRPSKPALISFFSRLSLRFWIFPSDRVFRFSFLLHSDDCPCERQFFILSNLNAPLSKNTKLLRLRLGLLPKRRLLQDGYFRVHFLSRRASLFLLGLLVLDLQPLALLPGSRLLAPLLLLLLQRPAPVPGTSALPR